MRAPLVQAEQDGTIRIQDLTKIVMLRKRLELAEERLVPFEAAGNVAYADDRPRAFHRICAFGLTTVGRSAYLGQHCTSTKALPPNQLSSTNAASLLAAVTGATLRTATVDNVAR